MKGKLYKNPIVFGDFADPSVMRVENDYFMVHGGGQYRSLLIWHSKDLVNWEPLYYALEGFSYSVWAPELIKYNDTYYIYDYSPNCDGGIIFVMTTKDIFNGPWTKPKSIGEVEGIDPGHIVTDDNKRYIVMSKNLVYPLSDDGLEVIGEGIKVCDDYKMPDDWDIEGVCNESPKLTKKDGYIYLTVAQGGTFGPPTSHCVISFRSKDLFGPYEPSPYNPICHTESRHEGWWSRGHGTLIDTKDGEWFIIYHGIMKDKRCHGRMTLMEQIEWTNDGWFKVKGDAKADELLSAPLAYKKENSLFDLNDDFSKKELSLQWNMQDESVSKRLNLSDGKLKMKCEGTTLHDSKPILSWYYDDAKEVTVKVLVSEENGAGLCFYFSPTLSCGIALEGGYLKVYNRGVDWMRKDINLVPYSSNQVYLKLKDNHGSVSPWYSKDGESWNKINLCFDISSFNVNASSGNFYGWVRPGLFAIGKGEVSFSDFKYKKLKEGK